MTAAESHDGTPFTRLLYQISLGDTFALFKCQIGFKVAIKLELVRLTVTVDSVSG